jgi:formylglycine-generating enzyme required for sulfatase activity
VKEQFAYTVVSALSLGQMHARLDANGPWRWMIDRSGESISSTPQPAATVLIAPEQASADRYVLTLLFESDEPNAQSQFYEMLGSVFRQVLPVVENLRATKHVLPSRELVFVPGGRFMMGLTDEEADKLARELVSMEVVLMGERQHLDDRVIDTEQRIKERRDALCVAMPAHEVEVGEFYIDRYPVTVDEYVGYMAETGAAPPDGWQRGRPPRQHFLTGISWREASALAAYNNASLPTEIEWERAARNGRSFFPWGDSYFPQGRVAFPDTGSALPWLVGSRPELASVHGVHDLIGEFGEFTADPFAPYPGADVTWFDRNFPRWRTERAVRGGFDVDQDSTTVYRNGIGEQDRARDVKVRLVRRAIR